MKKGILYVVLSGLCFLVVNLIVKLFSGNLSLGQLNVQSLPAHELVLSRSIVSFVISSIIIYRKGLPYFGVNKRWLLLRGIAGMVALTLFFMTLQNMPFAVAAVIQYLAPIFTMFFTFLILGERIFKIQWFFVSLAFFGVCLISFQNHTSDDLGTYFEPYWIGLGILSASISGIAYTAIVKLKKTDEPISIVLYFPMVSIPFMALLCLFDFVMPVGVEWLFLLLVGIFTQFAQILLTKALHLGSSSFIIPFQYLGIVYALLVGYFVFDERLNMIVNLGVLFIFLGIIMNAYLRYKKTLKS